MQYIQLNNEIVNNAKIIHMNRNSVVLELQPMEQIYCTRKVFNIIRALPNIPMYSIQREYQGITTDWLAIPLTL